MGVRDLMTANAELLRDEEQGYGQAALYMDPSTKPATAVPVTGIFEILGVDPVLRLQSGTKLFEQATFDVPATMTIAENSSFLIDGQTWKFTGRGGRDSNLQTITLQCTVTVDQRMANRRS